MDAFPASASRTQARGSSQRSGSEASAESKEARPSHVPAILGPGTSFSGLLAFSGEVPPPHKFLSFSLLIEAATSIYIIFC